MAGEVATKPGGVLLTPRHKGTGKHGEGATPSLSTQRADPAQTQSRQCSVLGSPGSRPGCLRPSHRPEGPALQVRPPEATLTLTQKSRVMKETATRRQRAKRMNQAVQCSQPLSPVMRMYSWGEAALLYLPPLRPSGARARRGAVHPQATAQGGRAKPGWLQLSPGLGEPAISLPASPGFKGHPSGTGSWGPARASPPSPPPRVPHAPSRGAPSGWAKLLNSPGSPAFYGAIPAPALCFPCFAESLVLPPRSLGVLGLESRAPPLSGTGTPQADPHEGPRCKTRPPGSSGTLDGGAGRPEALSHLLWFRDEVHTLLQGPPLWEGGAQ